MPAHIAQDYEKLGLFYLGRRYDMATSKTTDDLILYDSKDLLTHAVCIGMTGSGKTGLCLSLVEEAAIDNIPVIAIDPKGDLSNLLLTFPNLSPAEFQPWVNADDARQNNLSVEEFAAQQASAWKAGLAEWGEDQSRIKRLRDAAEFKVYTPGSNAGLPISIVQSLSAPDQQVLDDSDALRERVTTTANCLLALLGTSIDPLKSREHILLSNILSHAWRAGKDLTLALIIQQIQKPPITQVGAIDLESFFPAKERFELAMTINNLLAAPGFDAWLSGAPLNIDQLLHSQSGKPQVSIFSISHLSDTERMFFVSLLLGQLVSWTRSQSGTSSLRAILYMDEIFGYFPPVSNPPSKMPLLTLLKQARAYGLGLILATQNPVDLDYKGLANTGTWFIGRLQTERDKMRVLEGLEGAIAERGGQMDRGDIEKLLAGLGKRVFLMNNVHESRPELFQTRWTLSYLRGPLMKTQIKTLMDPIKRANLEAEKSEASMLTGDRTDSTIRSTKQLTSVCGATTDGTANSAANFGTVNSANSSRTANSANSAGTVNSANNAGTVNSGTNVGTANSAIGVGTTNSAQPADALNGANRPALNPSIKEYFLRANQPSENAKRTIYKPVLYGNATVRFVDVKTGLDETVNKSFVSNIVGDGVTQNWSDSQSVKYSLEDFDTQPVPAASFLELPTGLAQAANYKTWAKSFAIWLTSSQKYYLMWSPTLKIYSRPSEQDGAFRVRVQQKLNEMRDQNKEKLRTKYASKTTALEDRIRRAQQLLARNAQATRDDQLNSAMSVGATIFGAMMSRKPFGATTINKATSAARSVSRAAQKQADTARASESLQTLQAQYDDLQAQFQQELNSINEEMQSHLKSLDAIGIPAKKTNISVNTMVLLWVPSDQS